MNKVQWTSQIKMYENFLLFFNLMLTCRTVSSNCYNVVDSFNQHFIHKTSLSISTYDQDFNHEKNLNENLTDESKEWNKNIS